MMVVVEIVVVVFIVVGLICVVCWLGCGVVFGGWWWCDPGCNTVRSWLEHCEILNVTFLYCHLVTVSHFILSLVW